jgi:hypothetical protein
MILHYDPFNARREPEKITYLSLPHVEIITPTMAIGKGIKKTPLYETPFSEE